MFHGRRPLFGAPLVPSFGLSDLPPERDGFSLEVSDCTSEDSAASEGSGEGTRPLGSDSSAVCKGKRKREDVPKKCLEIRMEKFFDKFPCTPIGNMCKLQQWLAEEDLRYIRDNHPKYQIVCDVLSNRFLSWSIRQFANYFRQKTCQPVFAMPGGCNVTETVSLWDSEFTDVYEQELKDFETYYLDKEETLEWTSKLLDFQTEGKVKEFLVDLVDVLDKKRFKTNTIFVYSPTSGGKNFFFDFVLNFFLIRGQIGNMVRGERFSFMDCVDRRVLMFNEPNVSESPSTIDTLKMLFGGDLCPAAVKMKGQATIRRTPVFVLTNNSFLWRKVPEFEHRMLRYTWKSAPFLKDCKGYPHPLYFPDLLDKYEVKY